MNESRNGEKGARERNADKAVYEGTKRASQQQPHHKGSNQQTMGQGGTQNNGRRKKKSGRAGCFFSPLPSLLFVFPSLSSLPSSSPIHPARYGRNNRVHVQDQKKEEKQGFLLITKHQIKMRSYQPTLFPLFPLDVLHTRHVLSEQGVS